MTAMTMLMLASLYSRSLACSILNHDRLDNESELRQCISEGVLTSMPASQLATLSYVRFLSFVNCEIIQATVDSSIVISSAYGSHVPYVCPRLYDPEIRFIVRSLEEWSCLGRIQRNVLSTSVVD